MSRYVLYMYTRIATVELPCSAAASFVSPQNLFKNCEYL